MVRAALPMCHGGCIFPQMDHQGFLAGIDPATRARLTERSDAPGLWRLSLHAGAIVLLGGLIAAGVPGWWALLPVQGVLIVSLFTLEHEATHRTPFRSILAERLGRAGGGVPAAAPVRVVPLFPPGASPLDQHRREGPGTGWRRPRRPCGSGSGMCRACPTGCRRRG